MKTTIKDLPFENIKTNKFYKSDVFESIVISIEKGKILKKHISPLDVCLVVLEGEINFRINEETIILKALEHYSFKKNIEHKVEAIENAKFILIR